RRVARVLLQVARDAPGRGAAASLETVPEKPPRPAELRLTLAELAEQGRRPTTSAKVDRLLRLLAEFPDKLVLFTQFRATQAMLEQRLIGAGNGEAVFPGGRAR